MDREGFRNRLKQYKEARGLNPLLKYWEWKAQPAEEETPKYVGGGVVGIPSTTTADGMTKHIYYDPYTDLEYQNIHLPEVVVTASKNTGKRLPMRMPDGSYERFKFLGDAVKEVGGFLPVAGEVIDTYDLATDIKNKDWINTAVRIGSYAVPNIIEKGWKYGKKAYQFGKEAILAKMMDISRTGDANVVADRFRGTEWGNFLSSKNGDAYYRLQREKGLSSNDPEEKLFISHTTPWEEFLGLPVSLSLPIEDATPYLTGRGMVLYEFPTEVFGDLPASVHIPSAPLRNVSVIDQGKKHLMYGDTSSGARGRVRMLPSSLADMLHADPYRYDGILDRPLISHDGEFIYNSRTDYEDIFKGYQTVLQKRQLKDAIENGQHAVYELTPNGIQKTIHVGTPIKKDENIIDIFELSNWPTNVTVENAKNITDKQWDALFTKALNDGNLQEAQRLRDLHFVAKSDTFVKNLFGMPIETYHTVSERYDPNFTKFDPSIEGSHSAIYTTEDPVMSGSYSNSFVSEKELSELSETFKKSIMSGSDPIFKWEPERMKSLYLNLNNPMVVDAKGSDWSGIPFSGLPSNVQEKLNNIHRAFSTREIETFQKHFGYDGAIIKNVSDWGSGKVPKLTAANVYEINNPANLKLSQAITHDDAGKIIPLSKRDNWKDPDIRYSLAPIGLAGLAGLEYNDVKSEKGLIQNK